jgi:RecB family exonuclease
LRVATALEELVDEQGPPWSVTLPVPGGSRALELQNECAFRAFAELRLGARPLEEPARGVDPRLRGQLLHRALEKLWQSLRGSVGLAAHDESALALLIEVRVREAARELFAGAAAQSGPRVSEREVRRAIRLIAELCELERDRAPFTVNAMELARRLDVHGAALDVRLDRLDELEDGTLVILDYKSGRSVAQRWQEEPLSHPQLLAYLLAVTGEVAALATTHVARAGVEFRGIATREGLLPKVGTGTRGRPSWPPGAWSQQLESWRSVGRRLIDEFVAGDAAVEPAPNACAICHLHAFCRIAEWPSTASEEGDEHEGGEP